MKIWKLTQTIHGGYDTYDSCGVVAPTAEEAKQIYPGPFKRWGGTTWVYENGEEASIYDWALPVDITAELVGTVSDDPTPRVICASFNAG